jgi:hypothetical protein
MESNRLFRFPRPAWMNSANTRTFGVYTAGALVGSLRTSPGPIRMLTRIS